MMPRGGKARFDWMTLERLYVTGGDDVTYESLSGLPDTPSERTIRSRGAEGKWTDKRRQYRDKLASEAMKKALDTASTHRAGFVEETLKYAGAAKSVLEVMLSEMIEEMRKSGKRPKYALPQQITMYKMLADMQRNAILVAGEDDARTRLLLDSMLHAIEEEVTDPQQRARVVRRVTQVYASLQN